MSATRAVVLARGLGTRMRSIDAAASLSDAQRRAADAGQKAMMPIAGRPFLDYVLSVIADAGITHAAVVVAPQHDQMREYYAAVAPPRRLSLELIVQREAIGTADAVLAVERWTDGAPFLVLNGDNLYPEASLRALAASLEPALPGYDRDDLVLSSNIAPSRIAAFALIDVDDQGYLRRIVEKPQPHDVSPHALVSMNCWRFDRRIFEACRAVPVSPRGEYELPQAVGVAVQQGVRFRVLPARGPVLDLSQRADAAEVSRRLAGLVPRP